MYCAGLAKATKLMIVARDESERKRPQKDVTARAEMNLFLEVILPLGPTVAL